MICAKLPRLALITALQDMGAEYGLSIRPAWGKQARSRRTYLLRKCLRLCRSRRRAGYCDGMGAVSGTRSEGNGFGHGKFRDCGSPEHLFTGRGHAERISLLRGWAPEAAGVLASGLVGLSGCHEWNVRSSDLGDRAAGFIGFHVAKRLLEARRRAVGLVTVIMTRR